VMPLSASLRIYALILYWLWNCLVSQTQELVKLDAYKHSNFEAALAEVYYRLDELLDSEEGRAELKHLAGTGGAPTKGGLFSDIEDKLDSAGTAVSAEELLKETRTTSAEKEETLVESTVTASPGKKKLQRVDSSEGFRRSALTRNSMIPVDRDAAAEPLENLGKLNLAEASEEGIDNAHHASGMGCTALSAVIHGHMVIVANTGDSRCVKSTRGEAIPLTLDHKPIMYEEAQRIIRAGGFVRDNRVNGALNVSRTIGDLDFKKNVNLPHTEQMVVATPDLTVFEVQDGDEFLVLACDGIWDVLSNQEAVDFVRKRIRQGMPLKTICEAMCDHCLAPDLKGLCRGADNMSVIIVLFKKYANLDSFWRTIWSRITNGTKGR